jgi:UDP-glucose 4-epimerase
MKKNINVLFGERSNLSLSLSSVLNNAILLSGGDAQELLKYHDKDVKINVVINSFQRSTELGDLSNPKQYTEKTLGDLSNIIDVLINIKDSIDTVIYTSSAAVYGKNPYCHEKDQVHPISLYSSLKISSEIMVQNYLSAHRINYIIARVFNMYGGNDNFSIISKLHDCYINNKILTISNNGDSIRDYIHVDDVADIYVKLIRDNSIDFPILNVGGGKGYCLSEILQSLSEHGFFIKIKNNLTSEIQLSVANIDKINCIVDVTKFIDVNDYLLDQFGKA